MSQPLNEMINSDTHKGVVDKKNTLMFQPTEIRPSSRDGIFLSSQMVSKDEIKSRESNDSKALVSVKLEVCERDIEDEVSNNSRTMDNIMDESAVSYQDSVKSSVDDDISRDLECDKDSNEEPDVVSGDEGKEEAFLDRNYRRGGSSDGGEGSGPINNEEVTSFGRGTTSERRRVRRPRGRNSLGGSNSSYENKSEVADSPGSVDFGSIDTEATKLNNSGRGVFVEKRKRGRPRGSRGSRGANSSFENKSLNEVCGGAMDFGSGDIAMSSSGVLQYETPSPLIKVNRGALRPGCKSYRGRAAGIGRGYKMEYRSETPKWNVEADFTPIEYESALSPLTDVETSGRRQRMPVALTPPLPKRARGTRGRPRGRSRGRPRTSLPLDRSMDSDSADFGTPKFETPDYGTTGFESSDAPDNKSESEVDMPEGERSTNKRRRGRKPRGGLKNSTVDHSNEDASESAHEENMVTCSSCKEIMSQGMFTYHKLRKHNNCAWREGIDTPLDLSDAKMVNALLKQALQKRKQLTCEQCGLNRSSLVGYQSHVTFCAKTEGERDALMETCPVCNRRMMPSSLKVHMGVHRSEERAKKLEIIDTTPEVEMDPGEGSSKSSGKTKRAAANRAVSLMQQFIKGEDILIEKAGQYQVSSTRNVSELYEEKGKDKDGAKENAAGADENKEIAVSLYQVAAWTRAIQRCGVATCRNPGCTFKSAVKNELIVHYKTCEHRIIINFLCKMCSFGCELEEDMKSHVTSTHIEDSTKPRSDEDEFVQESAEESDEFDEDELDEDEDGAFDENYKEGRHKKIKKSKEMGAFTGRTPKYSKNVHFLAKDGVGGVQGLHAYLTTMHWTLDFQLTNYSPVPLYTDWRTRLADWVLIDQKEAEPYLPRARTSAPFSRVEVGLDTYKPPPGGPEARNALPWHQLSLFESKIEPTQKHFGKTFEPGFITLFAGGPVWAQAWCPTSLFVNCHDTEEIISKDKCRPVSQFMALSCNQDFDTYHSIGDHPKKEKNIIQIWDFGPLTNSENASIELPSMVLGIAHDYGAVWSLEWCPSGCYDEAEESERKRDNLKDDGGSKKFSTPKKEDRFLRRLGILAAACSDGTIRIFSIPFPSELAKEDSFSDLHEETSEHDVNCFAQNDSDLCKDIKKEVKTGICAFKGDVNEHEHTKIDENNQFDVKTDKQSSGMNSPIRSIASEGEDQLSAFETPTSSRSKSNRTPKNPKFSPTPTNKRNSVVEKKTSWPIYKPSFVVTLIVDSSNDSGNPWHCLRTSWSLLGKSHCILAASFSNGLVALWDLNTTSPLLRVHKAVPSGGTALFLRPYHVFLAHTNAVTALALVTCGAEKKEDTGDIHPRYIVTGARDRMLKFWDLHDTSAPITTFPRGLISNVVWLTNWLSCVVSNDDGFTHGRSNSKIQAIRQYGYKPCPLLSQNSAVMSVAHSDWLNSVAHGTYGGEACVLVAQQLLLAIESLKTLRLRQTMVFYTELIDFMEDTKEKSNPKVSRGKKKMTVKLEDDAMECDDAALSEEEKTDQKEKKGDDKSKTVNVEEAENPVDTTSSLPHTYAEAAKRYAILFCDLPVDHETGKLPKEIALKLQQSEKMKEVSLELYPIAAINKMCWNPNFQSFIWLATGHQSGLVRVCRIQKTRSKLLENFENRSAEKVAQMFLKRTKCDISIANPSESLQEDSNKIS